MVSHSNYFLLTINVSYFIYHLRSSILPILIFRLIFLPDVEHGLSKQHESRGYLSIYFSHYGFLRKRRLLRGHARRLSCNFAIRRSRSNSIRNSPMPISCNKTDVELAEREPSPDEVQDAGQWESRLRRPREAAPRG